MAQIAHQRYTFQKDFGKRDGRTDVEVNAAAIHSSHQLREITKVSVSCSAQRCAIEARMEVCDVAADRDVNGEGDLRVVRGTEEGIVAMFWIACDDRAPDCFAESDLILCAVASGSVE